MNTNHPPYILANTLPQTREQFFSDTEPGVLKDYARSFARNLAGLSDEAIWQRYGVIAKQLVSTLKHAQKLGVRVHERTSYSDFTEFFRRGDFGVITLVAHWQGAYYCSDDFLDMDAALDVFNTQSDFWKEIRSYLETEHASEIKKLKERQNCTGSFLATILNYLIRELVLFEPSTIESYIPADVCVDASVWLWNRRMLDHMMGDCVRKGTGIEFSDGLYSLEQTIQAIPPGCRGILELMSCQSQIMADAIMRRAGPQCVLITSGVFLDPRQKLIVYDELITECIIHGHDYIDIFYKIYGRDD